MPVSLPTIYFGAHLQKNFNELLLLCTPTWPSWLLSFESHRTEGHVSKNHLLMSLSRTAGQDVLDEQESEEPGEDARTEEQATDERGDKSEYEKSSDEDDV